jgi:hypothetical protein
VKALALLGLVACGDNLPPTGTFEVIGHSDLGARGMNSALAVAGDTVYVGSRTDGKPVLIVDVTDPAAPEVVGQLGLPNEAQPGMSSRELRAVPDLNLLIVLNLICSPDLHACSGGGSTENLSFYDITDRRAPKLVGFYPVFQPLRGAHDPHEFFLWRDPVDRTRVLVFLTVPGIAPQLDIIDATIPSSPMSLVQWDAVRDGGLPNAGANDIMHSISTSDDGRTAYVSHQTGGLVVVDTTNVIDKLDPTTPRMITPPANALLWANAAMGPHSAVKVPGRPLLVVTEEIYDPPFGTGCPWGHMHTVDITDATAPKIAGEFALPENAMSCSGVGATVVYTSHNATVVEDLALVTWYSGGLQAIDLTDPAAPFQLAEFRPDPIPQVAVEDPGVGGKPVSMWSYPVISKGLIYVVDIRNGLYVLAYHGRHGEEVSARQFLEGNSNLGAFAPRH